MVTISQYLQASVGNAPDRSDKKAKNEKQRSLDPYRYRDAVVLNISRLNTGTRRRKGGREFNITRGRPRTLLQG